MERTKKEASELNSIIDNRILQNWHALHGGNESVCMCMCAKGLRLDRMENNRYTKNEGSTGFYFVVKKDQPIASTQLRRWAWPKGDT